MPPRNAEDPGSGSAGAEKSASLRSCRRALCGCARCGMDRPSVRLGHLAPSIPPAERKKGLKRYYSTEIILFFTFSDP